MFAKLRQVFGLEPVDPLAHYYDDESPGPFDGLPDAERQARELLHQICKSDVSRVFVVAGTNGLSAMISEANGDPEPPRDGSLGDCRPLIDLSDKNANSFLDWCAEQPGLVEFDRLHGRLRRATINLAGYRYP